MKGIRQTTIFLLLLGAAVGGGVASAQSSGGQVPPANTTQNASPTNMNALRRQASELTLLNRLPEAARADAKALLDRADSLRQDMRQLQKDTLTAYVNALKKGEAPLVARELARESVASQRLRSLKSLVALKKDVQAFISTYPQAKALLRQFMGAERRPTEMNRMPSFGPRLEEMPFARGAHGFPGMRNGPATGFRDHSLQRRPQGPAPQIPPPAAPNPQTTPQNDNGN